MPFAGRSSRLAAAILLLAVPALGFNNISRGKQRRTVHDMEAIALALHTYADGGSRLYPKGSSIQDLAAFLVPTYLKLLPASDGWRGSIHYRGSGRHFALYSLGADRAVDRASEATIAALLGGVTLAAPPGPCFLEDDLLITERGWWGETELGANWYRSRWNDPLRRTAALVVLLPSLFLLLVYFLRRHVWRSREPAVVARSRWSRALFDASWGLTLGIPLLSALLVSDSQFLLLQYSILITSLAPVRFCSESM